MERESKVKKSKGERRKEKGKAQDNGGGGKSKVVSDYFPLSGIFMYIHICTISREWSKCPFTAGWSI